MGHYGAGRLAQSFSSNKSGIFPIVCVCFCYCVFLNTCDPGGCVWSVTRAQQVLTLDFFVLVIEVCK